MADPAVAPSPRGSLSAVEVALASVAATIAVAFVVAGWFLPHASAIVAVAAVPLGVVAHRLRFRALMASTVAASTVTFLVGGTGPVSGVIQCALVGGLVGTAKRHGWGIGRTLVATTAMAPVAAGLADGLLIVFGSLRKLTLLQLHNVAHGLFGAIGRLPRLQGVTRPANRWVDTALRDWWITVAVVVVVALFVCVLLAWKVLGIVLDRLAAVPVVDRLAVGPDGGGSGVPDGPVGPVPVALHDVGVRYPGADHDAVSHVSLALTGPELVAVVGPNGSGKSTLARVLAGAAPTTGAVERAGRPGLGRPDGTAMVQQRPDSQVLGVRVADDVVWGLPPDQQVDVASFLDVVGLAGMEEREAATLSGGELQRLAIAAALARQPRLLLSDESTAMVDAEGRAALTDLLARLPAEQGMTVVHVTHRAEEAARADRRLYLDHGRVVDAEPPPTGQSEAGAGGSTEPEPIAGGALQLRGVSHVYAAGTPWAQPALDAVDLEVEPGDGLLIVGGNGSGKSTLAWIMAGLLRPTAGDSLLDGRPVREQIGRVGLAFQHARLQVLRRTVRSDVRAAGGVSAAAADQALRAVGFDPAEVGDQAVEALSGGQLRRVALAGLLARRPGVMILDEPLAGLDRDSRAGILRVLAGLRRAGLTIVVISHDLHGTEAVCPRVVRLIDGRLAPDGPPAGTAARSSALVEP